MNVNELFKYVVKEEKIPRFIKAPILLCASWIFQGILYMDKTEKIFKLSLDIFLFFFLMFILKRYISTFMSVLIVIVIAHTFNWIFNGQLFVALKNLKLVKNDLSVFYQYINNLRRRVLYEESILAVAVFGSLSRGEIKETSDLDIRIIRKKGIKNGFKACFFVMKERGKAFFKKFPLDIYVLDNVKNIEKHIGKTEIEKLVPIYDPENVFQEL